MMKSIYLLPSCLLLAGCFVQNEGHLEGDAGVDPASDPVLDLTDGIAPDADSAWPDADDATDPPPDTAVDPSPDPADVHDDSWECATYHDAACDDLDVCTEDWCDMVSHTCVHSGASTDGTPCPDDGNECTDDFCRGGVCVHDGTPMEGVACTDDGEVCTDDVCQSASCAHPWIRGCCHRDGDCIWVDHIWECDSSTNTCYDPPQGHFCEVCTDRTTCGDGGSSSDDWCAYYTSTDNGCSKDCAGDYDCPRGAMCVDGAGSPCPSGVSDCMCVVKVGTCTTWRHFGDWCSGYPDCPGPDNLCRSARCTWACTTIDDCPLQSPGCVSGYCDV